MEPVQFNPIHPEAYDNFISENEKKEYVTFSGIFMATVLVVATYQFLNWLDAPKKKYPLSK